MRRSSYIASSGTLGRTGWLVLMAIGIALVFVLFSIKTRALEARAYVRKLEHKLEQEQAEVRMISAEIAHLESPERLHKLAAQHLDLQPVKAGKVLTLEEAIAILEKTQGKAKSKAKSGRGAK